MFIVVVVVAIPSTLIVLSEMRYFGQSGFSVYQKESEFHANVPNAASCTFQNKDDGQAGKKSMFPGNSHVKN